MNDSLLEWGQSWSLPQDFFAHSLDGVPIGMSEPLRRPCPVTVEDLISFGTETRYLSEGIRDVLCSIAGEIPQSSFHQQLMRIGSQLGVPGFVSSALTACWSMSSACAHRQVDWKQEDVPYYSRAIFLSAATVIKWFSKRYPTYERSEAFKQRQLQALRSLSSLPTSSRVVPSSLRENLDKDRPAHLFIGRPWVGKTSIATELANRYASREGHNLIVMRERSFHVLPFALEDLDAEDRRRIATLDRESDLERFSYAAICRYLNEFVLRQLTYGESFVVLLDDPFGHRKFTSNHPLKHLRINRWIEMARHLFGEVVVIVTSPEDYVADIRQDTLRRRSVMAENRTLLDETFQTRLSLEDYNSEELARIVSVTAQAFHAAWFKDEDLCGLIAEELKRARGSMLGLRRLCTNMASAPTDDVIDHLADLSQAWSVAADVSDLDEEHKRFLVAVLFGSELRQIYAEYRFGSLLTFTEVCQQLGIDEHRSKLEEDLEDWVHVEPLASGSEVVSQDFPDFLHPDHRSAVEDWLLTDRPLFVRKYLIDLVSSSTTPLWRHEVTHMASYFAPLWSREEAISIYENNFSIGRAKGFSPMNVAWALLGNWTQLVGSAVEEYALATLRRIVSDYPEARRPVIREVIEQAQEMTEPIFDILLKDVLGDRSESHIPAWNPENTLTFVYAVALQYRTMNAMSRESSEVERILELFSHYIEWMSQPKREIVGRRDDGLLNSRDARLSGRETLTRILRDSLDSGGMDEDMQISTTLRVLSGQA